MAKRSIQGYVELTSGLGELTRSRAKEAAAEIVALAGSDASRKKAAKQVSGVADELLRAAQANRKHLVRLIRREVESALAKLDVNERVERRAGPGDDGGGAGLAGRRPRPLGDREERAHPQPGGRGPHRARA